MPKYFLNKKLLAVISIQESIVLCIIYKRHYLYAKRANVGRRVLHTETEYFIQTHL